MLSDDRPQPLFPEIGILALVPDEWGPLWQVRHHVLTRLSLFFNVVWLEPPEPWQIALRRWRGKTVPVGPEARSLEIFTPGWSLPEIYRVPWMARMAFKERLKRAARILDRKGCRHRALYVWRPQFSGALDLLRHDFSCYHIDDEYSFGAATEDCSPEERRLISRVDRVIVHSPGLMERKGDINPHTVRIPNGADCAAFIRAHDEPADLARIPRPRIGYTGYIKNQLDFPTLESIARSRPDCSLALVGEVGDSLLGSGTGRKAGRRLLQRLKTLPNVHLLGRKTTAELAAYPQHLEACLLPYRVDGYTECIYPMKMHEYLASGTPVIGSPIRSVLEFEHAILLASTPGEWLAAIDEALDSGAADPQAARKRREIAMRHDWERVVARIAAVFAEGLGPSFGRRLEEALAASARRRAADAIDDSDDVRGTAPGTTGGTAEQDVTGSACVAPETSAQRFPQV